MPAIAPGAVKTLGRLGGRFGGRDHAFGQSEVEHLGPPRLGDDDVLRLQVPVQHAAFVRMGQRVGNLHGVIDQAIDRQADAGRDDAMERLAIDELHGEKRLAVVFADLVNRADVGMIHRGSRAGLAQQERAAASSSASAAAQDLDRDVAPELLVVGAIDLAHPAAAEQRGDPVRAQLTPFHGRGVWAFYTGTVPSTSTAARRSH